MRRLYSQIYLLQTHALKWICCALDVHADASAPLLASPSLMLLSYVDFG